MNVDHDQSLRVAIYQLIVDTGFVPSSQTLAAHLKTPHDEVKAGFQRLASGRVLVLQPDGEILMANPFSAVPTGFVVESEGKHWWGNCIWDSLGIFAALQRDGCVRTSCGCCGSAMEVRVANGRCSGPGLAHFAIPAKHWWDDIVFN
ncbi:MAG TPA: organomercurial lyase [Terriglobales bacterium]|nr:organomercurial lyase [Terriglobales bacterium]